MFVAVLHPVQRQTLHMTELAPDMSGDYTCVVQSRGQEVRQTKTMIVFSKYLHILATR